MSKTLSRIFPILDHLYIYQILEYNSWDFLKWFLKNPLARELQRKHKLEWTTKAKLLAFVGISLLILDSIITSYILNGGLLLFLLLLPIKSLYSPLFLIVAQILISPFEVYQKEKILNLTAEKLKELPDLKIVGITGSFGKTSTKDILYTLLWKKYYVVKTPKSFNTPLGVAQTILEDVKDNTQILIAEVGAYKRGEIAKISQLIKPKIGIITAVAPQHLERFGSIENIAKAKFELVENLSQNGTAILNGDSDLLQNLASNLQNVIYYGKGNKYAVSGIKATRNGTTFILHTPKGATQITIPLIGEHHVQNFLAASVAALQLGLTLSEIKIRAKLLLPTPHRLEIRKQGNLTIIDNTYNTNSKSSRSSLDLLAVFSGSQKILITPGLVELGSKSAKENQIFAKEAAKTADQIIIVGKYAKKHLLAGLSSARFPKEKTFTAATLNEAMLILGKISTPGAVVLLENDLPDQYF